MPTRPILRAAAAFVHGPVGARLSMQAANLVTHRKGPLLALRVGVEVGGLHHRYEWRAAA